MKQLRKIQLLILVLRDLILPEEGISSLVYRKLAMVPIRSATLYLRQRNRSHINYRGDMICRKR